MQGGKPFYDRQRAGELRTKALEDIILVLNDDPIVENWGKYRKDMLMKLSTNILPRLNEVTGQDGGAIEIKGVEINVRK